MFWYAQVAGWCKLPGFPSMSPSKQEKLSLAFDKASSASLTKTLRGAAGACFGLRCFIELESLDLCILLSHAPKNGTLVVVTVHFMSISSSAMMLRPSTASCLLIMLTLDRQQVLYR
jgi:hypothetical protein